jgi:hypothetical protein
MNFICSDWNVGVLLHLSFMQVSSSWCGRWSVGVSSLSWQVRCSPPPRFVSEKNRPCQVKGDRSKSEYWVGQRWKDKEKQLDTQSHHPGVTTKSSDIHLGSQEVDLFDAYFSSMHALIDSEYNCDVFLQDHSYKQPLAQATESHPPLPRNLPSTSSLRRNRLVRSYHAEDTLTRNITEEEIFIPGWSGVSCY